MKRISVIEINDLVSKFSEKSLPKEEWTHQAHLIVGLFHLMHYDFDTALDMMKSKIKTYNLSVGTLNTDSSGYHETLTIFWMILIKSFLLKHNSLSTEEAVNHFLQSKYATTAYPLSFYSKDVLFSKEARKEWVNGDKNRISMLSITENLNSHYDFSNEQFVREFSDCTFPPSLFSHEAHLRLAWIAIQSYGTERAAKKIQEQILNFVEFLGAADKYHTTLTVAAVKVVGHFVSKSTSNNFKDFIREFPQLKNNFKSLIEQHYSFDIFNSKTAKHKYLEPDKIPF